MKKWHPPSWSQQARDLGNAIIESVNMGYRSYENGRSWFHWSYRSPIVRYRAAKRFYKMDKLGKVRHGEQLIE